MREYTNAEVIETIKDLIERLNQESQSSEKRMNEMFSYPEARGFHNGAMVAYDASLCLLESVLARLEKGKEEDQ